MRNYDEDAEKIFLTPPKPKPVKPDDAFANSPKVATYRKSLESREDRREQHGNEDIDKFVAQQLAPVPQPVTPKAQAPKEKPNVIGDTLVKGVGGGLIKAVNDAWTGLGSLAVNSVLDLGSDVNQLSGNLWSFAKGERLKKENTVPVKHNIKLEKPFEEPNPETLPGQLVKPLVAFLAPYLTGKGALTKAGAKPLAADFVASAGATVAGDPDEERLSNMVNEYAKDKEGSGWKIAKALTEYIKAEDDDSKPLAYLKSVAEDALMGAFSEVLIGTAKLGKAKLKLMKEAPELVDSVDNVLKTVGEGIESGAVDIKSPAAMADINARIKQAHEEALNAAKGIEEKKLPYVPEDVNMRSLEEQADIKQGLKTPEDTADFLERVGKQSDPDELIVPEVHAKPREVITETDILTDIELDDSFTKTFTEPFDSPTVDDIERIVRANGISGKGKVSAVDIDAKVANREAAELQAKENSEIAIQKQIQDTIKAKQLADTLVDIPNPRGYNLSIPEGASAFFDDSVKYLDAASDILGNQRGGIDVRLLTHGGAGLAGGGSGLFVDYNQDGKIGHMDVALGFALGTGMSIGISKLHGLHKGQDAASMKTLLEEPMSRIQTYRDEMATRIASGSASVEDLEKFAKYGKALDGIEQRLKGAKNFKELQKELSPKHAELLKKKLEPKVKVHPDGKEVREMERRMIEGDPDWFNELEKQKVINMKYVDTPEEVAQVYDTMVDTFSNLFEKHKGKRSWEQASKIADDIGIDIKNINTTGGKVKNLDARIYAARALVESNMSELKSTADRILKAGAEATPEDLVYLRKKIAHSAAVMAQVTGIKSEVARALNSMKMLSTARTTFDDMNSLVATLGGKEGNLEIARKIASLPSKAEKLQYAKGIALTPSSKVMGVLQELYYGSILSGPITHVRNITGNLASILLHPLTKYASAPFGGGMRAIREGNQYIIGVRSNLMDAWKMAKQAAKEGESAFDPYLKMDGRAYKFIDAKTLNINPETTLGHFIDTVGHIARAPMEKGLGPADDFFKVLNYRGSLYEQAYSRALDTMPDIGAKSAEEMGAFIEGIIRTPPADIHDKAMMAARRATYTDKPGFLTQKLTELVNHYPAARFVVPFIKTPANIMKQTARFTPGVGALMDGYSGFGKQGKVAMQMAMGQQALGLGIYATAGFLAFEGIITGGGPRDNTSLRLTGWQPYSFKVGNKYISFEGLEPFSSWLGISADMVDAYKYGKEEDWDRLDEVAIQFGKAMAKNTVSKSYMKGFADMVDAVLNGDANFLEKTYKRVFSAVVPNAVAQVNRGVFDKDMHETRGVVDEIISKIPGMSKTLPKRYDFFGSEMQYGDSIGPDVISPFYTSDGKDDVVRSETAKHRPNIRDDMKELNAVDGLGLSPEEQSEFAKVRGGSLYSTLDRLFKSKSYQKAHPDDQKEWLNTAIIEGKARGKHEFYKAFPDVRQRSIDLQKETMRLKRESRKQ